MMNGLRLILVLSAALAVEQHRSAAADAAAAAAGLNRTNLLEFLDETGQTIPVKSLEDWPQRRAAILQAMQKVMGPFPDDRKRGPLEVRIEEEVDCGSYLRRRLSYASEPGSRVPAYLLIPKEALSGENPAIGILCLHQTHALGHKVVAGLGGSPDDEYGVELAERGYVCLAPAYPLLAEYHPDLKGLGYESGTMKAIWDNSRGLDLLESLPFVKKGAFGAIGHSLGGHNSIYTAAFDNRVKVIVSSCGLDAYRHYMGGNIEGWTSDRYMPRLSNYSLPGLPFDFDEIIALLAPRVCFISAPIGDTNFQWWSVDEVIQTARPVYELHGCPENLRAAHPDAGHVFPSDMREAAYRLFDEHLRAARD